MGMKNQTFTAIYDGHVLHPENPLPFKPNTRVQVVLKGQLKSENQPQSFLQTARRLKIEGPPDWSDHLETYLYDQKIDQ